MTEKFIPTGNEMISIPEIRESDASICSVNFLHMGFKGLIEIRGGSSPGEEFMCPFCRVDGKDLPMESLEWDNIHYWVPRFKTECGSIVFSGLILAPMGERGFIYKLSVMNQGKEDVDISTGLKGYWKYSLHTINESKLMNGSQYIYKSNWNKSFIMDFRNVVTLFSIAPMFYEKMDNEIFEHGNDGIRYELSKSFHLCPGETCELTIFWGIGIEEVGAATSAQEMMRKGFEKVMQDTCSWLLSRQKTCANKELEKLFNRNLFFNYFYASGITLDTEEFVLVTSRSPRYYVSAAYWDRDSLLWSFPSILITDVNYARNMLEYVFTKQIKNVGIHSRYIDGTMLEPGFELDELCAPVIALHNYISYSGDMTILNENYILKDLKKILNLLESKKHREFDLYETFLQPTDDMNVYPYITYDNVLVWKTFLYMAEMLKGIEGVEFCNKLLEKADRVEKAIWDHCVVKMCDKEMFAWSVDLNGQWNIYDEPPGSLQLLPFYGFCDESNQVYQNTVEYIRRPEYKFSFHNCRIAEIGCEHAPHPWVLSIANSLICGRKKEFIDILPVLKMDNGIACESVDETTGECTTGEAFATCAGFLSYAIYYAFFEQKEK